MFDFSTNVFYIPKNTINPESKVIFVADLFTSDYVGGAELTTQALIDSSPYNWSKIKSKDLTIEIIEKNKDKYWIFGNFAEVDAKIIQYAIANLKYSILEYDYKYCRARSPEKHYELTKVHCDCANGNSGKIVSMFFMGAMHLFWMSKKQQEKYLTLFPFLVSKNQTVLSSVFDIETLNYINQLRSESIGKERKNWIVLGGNSWVKGFEAAENWCKNNNKTYEVVWNVEYKTLLKKLSLAEGFVYLPAGGDTCPRMVIEAKLLGCKLHLNDFVQHKDESWFETPESIESYLRQSTNRFWTINKQIIEYKPTISGYTTTLNCVKQNYPFVECIKSMLEFCTEICVVDGGSSDGTWEKLIELSNEYSSIKIKSVPRDWNHPRSALFDGMQKAEARKMCTSEFCWQMDSDEIVHEEDAKKIEQFCVKMPIESDILALPVIEYWGGEDKVRLDIQPWKWRLSRNKSNITHGVPIDLRRYDDNSQLYSLPGSDGCDMIDSVTGVRIPHMNFYSQEIETIRLNALRLNSGQRELYEKWFNQVTTNLPCVFHYSWYNLGRKIRLYRDYWTSHWTKLYGKSFVDSVEQNMMFNVPWKNVTEEMIDDLAVRLQNIGGWIWHSKWNGQQTPWIKSVRKQPLLMIKKDK